jgi:hypothetical protein
MSPKNGFKALGLCLIAVLGLMGITAVGAQAKGDWRIEGANTATTAEFTSEKDGTKDFTILTGTGGTEIEVLCQELTTDDGLLLAPTKTESGKGLVTLLFKGCKTFLNGSLSEACKPIEPIVAKLKFLLVLHNKTTYLLLEPDVGTTFAAIKFEAGCALPEIVITGSLAYEDGNEPFENESVKRLMLGVPAPLFGGQTEGGTTLPNARLLFGVNSVKLEGSIWWKLAGANLGKKWSGLAL